VGNTFGAYYTKPFGNNAFIFDAGDTTVTMPINSIYLIDTLMPKPVFSFLHIMSSEQNGNTEIVSIFNRRQIVLPYYKNNFSIYFSLDDITKAAYGNYAYLLEGLDGEVHKANASNPVAVYNNLKPGTYKLTIYASSEWGDKFTGENSFTIIIKPAFWQTWWFNVLMVLLGLGVVYALYRYRLYQATKLMNLRNDLAADLHDEVGSTLSSIAMITEVAILKHDKDPEQSKQLMNKLKSNATNMLEKMDDIVWSIHPQNDDLSDLLLRMSEYITPLANAKEVKLNWNIDSRQSKNKIALDKRKNVYLIFKEVVNNALKYSQCKHIVINIQAKQHDIYMHIEDDGIGFNEIENSKRNGLRNMRKRAVEIGAHIQIKSQVGKGTTVALIPQ
jgi:two-component sensor histidine kinase